MGRITIRPVSTAGRLCSAGARGRRLGALLALLLAGCGGGLFLSYDFSDDDFDSALPAVSLAADAATAPAGATVMLIAAASDANGIDNVAFFQLDSGNSALLLGTDASAPYGWLAAIPAGVASVRYFARATDGVGRQADSETVTVVVGP